MANGGSSPVLATTPDDTPSVVRGSAGRGGAGGGTTSGGGGRGPAPARPRLTRRNSTVRSDSTDSIAGLLSISSSWRSAIRSEPSSAIQNSVRRPSATTTPRAPPVSASRTSPRSATIGLISARATSSPMRLQLGGKPRRQWIVVGDRQQHDARVTVSAVAGAVRCRCRGSACAAAAAARKQRTKTSKQRAAERTDQ